jgi:hypothetical protein
MYDVPNFFNDLLLISAHSRYVNQSEAMTQGLTYINSHGNAIIKVDNTTYSTDPTYGRNSVYMMSQGTINVGSLLLFQAKHMPYGCGVCVLLTSRSLDGFGTYICRCVRARIMDFGE